ncbi:2-amino-4-hydroxy-6-hydroxymethyldihydropteridine diphosphokinase [Microaerobacter geothermalis]|uniref:2-amino-4-hydroxy-6- hydroxymethyldihydropteridine diphosphokinase n=1 Tax=Microaerobacter geothermalis TaxID=674972 RepID=UPI001F3C0DC8|nr:2-amino-4-hydroxy-6-hydroxymethyldihydropteridine diphosphokinase [Microaerobacter geothermalis]MCF6094673.1 2-amino-4-hydroxy-6-hydroxymethyldihydropteridine diphosphokinase [Microaerobacter geothermalis]
MKPCKAYLGLGANIGDREDQLIKALELINSNNEMEVTKLSSVYETEPVGYIEQPPFLNMVIEINTYLEPEALLYRLLFIEKSLGRERKLKWGPRTIDIDILLYDKLEINRPDLIIPHPRMIERAFVIIPLMDLNPDLMIPGLGKSVKELAKTINIRGITPLKEIQIVGEQHENRRYCFK